MRMRPGERCVIFIHMEWIDFSHLVGVSFSEEQLKLFAALGEMVARLNRKHNLVSAGDLPLLRERHIQDSLMALLWTKDAQGAHLDLGSGTGFPLLPLAIAQPGRKFVGVESRSTRVMQMRYLAGELGLENVELVESRIEELPAALGPFETVTSRALGSLSEDWRRAEPYLRSGGRFVTFKSERADDPVDGTTPRNREYRLHSQLKSYFSVCLEKNP